jgi:hypothetical protein
MANLNIAVILSAKDQGASSVVGGLTKTLGGLGTIAMAGAAVGIAALGAGLAYSVGQAMEAQDIMAQTQAVIKSTGGAAGMTAQQVSQLATSLQNQSRFSDESIQSGENLLLTFTNIGKDTFPLATQAMVDMATAMKTDVSGGAIQLGKALNDPTKGITALTRVGVTFTDAQKKLIKSLQDSGDMAGAQKVILDELTKEFGGSAAASAQTFAGKLDVMKNRLSNVAEAIGGPLLTAGGMLIDKFITPAIPLIEEFGTRFTDALNTVIGIVTDSMTLFGNDLPGAIANMLYELDQFIPGAANVGDAFLNIVAVVQANLPMIQTTVGQVFGFIQAHSEEIKGALIGIGVVLAGAGIISGILAVAGAVAALVTPVGLVIAAAALLGAAWAGNWGDIQGKTAVVWAWLQPLLAQLWQWLQVTIPLALAWLANFWQTVLLPAIQSVWAWVQGTLFPLLATLWAWLQTNIPIALQTLATFWTGTLQPAIAGVWAWVTGTLLPTLSTLWTWLQTTLTAALQNLADFWNNTLMPALVNFKTWYDKNLLPLLTALGTLLSVTLTLALKAMADGWTLTVLPAITGAWSYFTKNILPVLQSVVDKINLDLKPVLDNMGAWINGLVSGALAGLNSTLGNITTAIQTVIGWINTLIGLIPTIPSVPGVGGPPVNGRAAGGPVSAFTPYVVGEAGPEVFVPSSNGTIIPNGAGAGLSIYIDARGAGDPSAVEAAGYRGAQRALAEAGYHADQLSRMGVS